MACDLSEPRGCPLIILDRSVGACSVVRGRTRRVLLPSQHRCPRKPPRKTQTRVERNISLSFIHCQVETIASEEVSSAGRGFFLFETRSAGESSSPAAMQWAGEGSSRALTATVGLILSSPRCGHGVQGVIMPNYLLRLAVCTCHLMVRQWVGLKESVSGHPGVLHDKGRNLSSLS